MRPKGPAAMSNFTDARHSLYVGWVAGIAARHGVPLIPVVDSEGDYTDELQLDLPGDVKITVVVPYPPKGWSLQ